MPQCQVFCILVRFVIEGCRFTLAAYIIIQFPRLELWNFRFVFVSKGFWSDPSYCDAVVTSRSLTAVQGMLIDGTCTDTDTAALCGKTVRVHHVVLSTYQGGC